jgi:hypothetical protein
MYNFLHHIDSFNITVSNFLQHNVHVLLFTPAGSSDGMVNRTGESTRIQQELYIREDRSQVCSVLIPGYPSCSSLLKIQGAA